MASKEQSSRQLIAQALKSAPEEADHWNALKELQLRNDRETFLLAVELCGSKCPAERALGADILGQLGSFETRPIAKRKGRAPSPPYKAA